MLTRHCHNCGWEYTLKGLVGRSETCHGCGADLKVCLNCVSYDPRVAQQCRDRRAEPVAEKHLANFCEWFDFIKREWAGKKAPSAREQAARENLRKLFGD
jgi:ribosome-binding protein aMBF1 (putative translation factor)